MDNISDKKKVWLIVLIETLKYIEILWTVEAMVVMGYLFSKEKAVLTLFQFCNKYKKLILYSLPGMIGILIFGAFCLGCIFICFIPFFQELYYYCKNIVLKLIYEIKKFINNKKIKIKIKSKLPISQADLVNLHVMNQLDFCYLLEVLACIGKFEYSKKENDIHYKLFLGLKSNNQLSDGFSKYISKLCQEYGLNIKTVYEGYINYDFSCRLKNIK